MKVIDRLDMSSYHEIITPAEDFKNKLIGSKFKTILADPPWQFRNRSGKVSPEYKNLFRYNTLALSEIINIPVNFVADSNSHLYLWVPNALIDEGLQVMKAWGFNYKTNIVWSKTRKDGGSDEGGMGYYFRNNTELLLFGIKGKLRTLLRNQVNIIKAQRREHSRKPDEQYSIIESCSPGPYLEMFARGTKENWIGWGNEA